MCKTESDQKPGIYEVWKISLYIRSETWPITENISKTITLISQKFTSNALTFSYNAYETICHYLQNKLQLQH